VITNAVFLESKNKKIQRTFCFTKQNGTTVTVFLDLFNFFETKQNIKQKDGVAN
jgi:uncharacterized protein YjhX (UPF0386 family)